MRLVAVVLILLAASALRLADLQGYPVGLYVDPAYNGLDALEVLRGHLSIFFAANNGREPLFIYMQAASVGLFGPTRFALRLPSAFAGLATIALASAWARSWFGPRVGMVTALFLAVSLWHADMSRIGLRVITLPCLLLLTFYLLNRCLRRKSLGTAMLAGLAAGLAMYTYASARLLPLLLLAILVLEAARLGACVRRYLSVVTVAALAWLAVFSPLAWYSLAHRDEMLARTRQVSLLSNEYDDHGHRFTGTLDHWAHVLGSAKAVAGMFVVAGDGNPRHNVPGQPVFDPIVGALFLLGLARTAHAAWRPCVDDHGAPNLPAWLVLWWVIMAFSSAFATEAPHYHRTAGSMPPTYAFAALGLNWLWRRRAVVALAFPWHRALLAALVVAVSARQWLCAERALFGPFARSEAVAVAWQAGLTRFGEDVAGAPGRRPAAAYLQAGDDSRELRVTTAFFAGDGPPVHWLPPDQLILPIPESVGGDVLYGGDVRQSLDTIVPVVLPEASLDVRVHGPPGAPDYALYRLSSAALASERSAELPTRATFGGQVRLYGAAVRPAAGSAGQPSWIVRLRWSFLPEARGQYDLFVQALDASGKLAAQDDHGIPAEALPGGQQGLTAHRLISPAGSRDRFMIIAGVATADGAQRLQPEGDALRVRDNAVVLMDDVAR